MHKKKDPLIFSSVDNFKLKWLFWNALSRKRQREFDESYLFYKSLFSTVIKTLKDPQSSATIKIEQHESHWISPKDHRLKLRLMHFHVVHTVVNNYFYISQIFSSILKVSFSLRDNVFPKAWCKMVFCTNLSLTCFDSWCFQARNKIILAWGQRFFSFLFLTCFLNVWQNAVKMQSKCSRNAVKIQPKWSQNSIKMQPKFSQNTGKIQSVLGVLIDWKVFSLVFKQIATSKWNCHATHL